ncbi:MAG: DUF4838 domain-containing protein [Lentisphaeria bacterium]|nr:DUF4838 domain-containing protein [Lentisphaeria bacterium]
MKCMLSLLAALTILSGWSADFTLVRNNQPKASIVCGEDSSAPVKTAVANFNDTLNTITGTRLPVVPDGAEGNRIKLVVRKPESLHTADNFTIRFPDERTMEIEGTEHSVQWAFNHIIREFAKAEWVLPEECGLSYTPLKDLTVPTQTVEVKDVSWPLSRTLSVHHTWWMQNLRDGTKFSHELLTFAFPLSKYGKDNSWPEAMMPVLNGKKITALPNPERPRLFWQPCYSNPETAKIAVENILEYMKSHPDTLAVGLSVNDNQGYCECGECLKLDKEPRLCRSESYYTFVNRVAEELCKTYPNLPIKVGAYDRTYQPPSFKLHPNVLVRMTIDFNSCVSPKMLDYHKRIIAEWGSKASMLGVWDYSWGYPYPMPRLYAPYHLDMLKYLHEHNGRAYDAECWTNDAYEGPKHYLISKFLWNSDQDMKKLEEEWYVRCVGKKAAPYLKAYYKIWNDYFTGPAMKTPWGKSATGVYMAYNDVSCVYALQESDIQAADEAMKQVVALSETAQEQARAVILMRLWRHTYLRLRLLGAGIYDDKGSIHTPDAALKLLAILSKSAEYIREYEALSEILIGDKNLRHYYLSNYYIQEGGTPVGRKFDRNLDGHILAASKFADQPEVKERMQKIYADQRLPGSVRALCKLLISPESYRNHIPEGDAESGVTPAFSASSIRYFVKDDSPELVELSATEEFAASGKKSFQLELNSHNTVFRVTVPGLKPGKRYVLTFKAFIEKPSEEGYIQVWCPGRDAIYHESSRLIPFKLSGSVWQNCTVMSSALPSDKLFIRIYLRNFSKGDKVYLDDLKLMEIDDL